ncbi:MAG: response regulator [Chthoniobacteraceae bacterium]
MTHDVLRKARVLIVDDEPSNVRLLERILELNGEPSIRSTTDSRETLSILLEFEPDIVLLDLHMPHLDGFGVMELLKSAIAPDTYLPILVLTADITAETKRRAFLAGAQDFLTKPLDHSEVVLRMKNLLENRFLHLELQDQNKLLEQQVRVRTGQLEQTLSQLRNTQTAVIKQERLRALGLMAGGIAHDFNNALTMMLGYGELLLPHFQGNAPDRERGYLAHMIAAAEDARHIVARLREFYRPAGSEDVRVPVDLNAIVEQAVALTTPRWKGSSQANGVQINVVTDLREIPAVAASASELREMLTNFIFNSVDAMPEGGTISLATRVQGEHVCVSITDTGMGMDPEQRAQCLEPFFTTKGDGGTGLGLSVVYGIVQRHGGNIEIISEKNRGTTFLVMIPPTTDTAVPAQEKSEPISEAVRVLVADDQEIIAELIAEYLRSDGHQVTLAFDGRAALEKFRAGTFDLVLTDQSMPGLNGTQLALIIKAERPNTPVVLLTGFGDEMQASGQSPEGIDLVVSKPISQADLRRAVSRSVTAKPSQAA